MTKKPYFEIYRDKRGGWRWRLRAGNRKIVADCAESYRTKRSAVRGLMVARSADEIREAE